jgi:hypothetical protein
MEPARQQQHSTDHGAADAVKHVQRHQQAASMTIQKVRRMTLDLVLFMGNAPETARSLASRMNGAFLGLINTSEGDENPVMFSYRVSEQTTTGIVGSGEIPLSGMSGHPDMCR